MAATNSPWCLPEARDDEASASLSASAKPLVADQEQPPISASIGISIYQGEGERVRNCWRKLTRISTKKRRGGKPSANLPTLPAAA